MNVFPRLYLLCAIDGLCVNSAHDCFKHWQEKTYPKKSAGEKCEGWDLNPRIPTKLAPQASAFDQARQPSPLRDRTAMQPVNLAKGLQPSAFDLARLPSLCAITKRLSI